MKNQVALLFIFYGLLTQACADLSYRGRAYVKKTGLDSVRDDVRVMVRVVFRSQIDSQKTRIKILPEDTTYGGLGAKAINSFFDVDGKLDVVEFTATQLDDPEGSSFEVCKLLIAGSQIKLGTRTFPCKKTPPRGNGTGEWKFYLKIDVSLPRNI